MNDIYKEEYFHQRIDYSAAFFQVINNFKKSYILTELIQNELDAHSTETTIEFLKDKIISFGNGKQIKNNEWEKLSVLFGSVFEHFGKIPMGFAKQGNVYLKIR